MGEFISIMTLPFLACLVLTGIHAYLGLHVIEREVIFVDLAIAQIAALGASVALLVGLEEGGSGSYWLSLAFTVGAAGIFSLTRFKKQRIPQEAVIGITYAVSAALLILVLSRSGEGDEHIRESLIGNILLVRGEDVLKMAAVYSIIGIFHFVFRRKFLLISQDPQKAQTEKINIRLWDFLFYATFGVIVTSSVRIAGVLLVFAYLVVPAAAAMLFTTKTASRLWFGWGMGALASLGGMALSYFWDFPTGASVVAVFGVMLAGLAGARALIHE